jgi:hypothetical protein
MCLYRLWSAAIIFHALAEHPHIEEHCIFNLNNVLCSILGDGGFEILAAVIVKSSIFCNITEQTSTRQHSVTARKIVLILADDYCSMCNILVFRNGAGLDMSDRSYFMPF